MERILTQLPGRKTRTVVGFLHNGIFFIKSPVIQKIDEGFTYNCKLYSDTIQQLRDNKDCSLIHFELCEDDKTIVIETEFADWLINCVVYEIDEIKFTFLHSRYWRKAPEFNRIDNLEKKTRKQELSEQMATIDMHRDSCFCRKCEKITGKEPQMNCQSGRFWIGKTSYPTRRKVKYYFLAESPGKDEAADPEGRFLIGRSGREFERWLIEAGIDEKDVYVDNVVRCSLKKDFGLHTTQQKNKIMENCKTYLFSELDRLQPQVIIPMGRVALQALIGAANITKWMGRTIIYPKLQCYIVPILHPAAILRGRAWERNNIINIISELSILAQERPKLAKIQDKFVLTDKDFNQMLRDLKKVDEFTIDLETIGLDERANIAQILGICLSVSLTKGYFLPLWAFKNIMDDNEESTLGWDFDRPRWTKTQMREIRKLFKSKKILKVFHNAGFDFNWLEYKGYEVSLPIYDTMIANSVLDNIDNGLKDLAWLHTSFGGYEEELENVPKINKKRLDLVDPFVLAKYGAYDSVATKCIKKIQDKQRTVHPANDLLPSLMELRYNLSKMELLGCRIDLKKTKELKKEYEIKLVELHKDIEKLLQVKDLNINSTVQMVSALFGDFGLFKGMVDKPSTDKRVLEELQMRISDKGPTKTNIKRLKVIELLLEYRKLSKLLSTYLNMFLERHDENSRIHPHFTVHVTVTGRLSSKDPNLQNIPRKGGIRDCFIADKGCVLIEFDYSQLELRIAAEYSRDERMLDILNDRKGDIHSQVGVVSFKRSDGGDYPIARFKEGEPRAKAKIISFSTIYGKTPMGLARDLGCTLQEASRIFNFFFEGFPGLKQFVDMQQAYVQKYGCVETIFGRRLMIDGAQSYVKEEIEAAYRKCVNYPIQSAASDVLVLALNRLARRIKKEKWPAQMTLTVHDSILFNAEKGFRKECTEMVLEEMEREIPQIQAVRLYTDHKHGFRWGTAK